MPRLDTPDRSPLQKAAPITPYYRERPQVQKADLSYSLVLGKPRPAIVPIVPSWGAAVLRPYLNQGFS
jgi:hypothetical protein